MEAKPLDPKKPPKTEDDSHLVEKWGSKDKAGKPSAINHSNFPPTIDSVAGGVTIDKAEHTVVLSLAALRRLGFAEGGSEARLVLASLGLVAILAAERSGHDLRSRCLLVPQWDKDKKKSEALSLESVARDGQTKQLLVDFETAIALYHEAVEALPESLKFDKAAGEPLVTLSPSPKLAHLITKSRELAAAGAELGDD